MHTFYIILQTRTKKICTFRKTANDLDTEEGLKAEMELIDKEYHGQKILVLDWKKMKKPRKKEAQP